MFRIYKNIFKSPHLAECGEVGAGDVWRRTYGDEESRQKNRSLYTVRLIHDCGLGWFGSVRLISVQDSSQDSWNYTMTIGQNFHDNVTFFSLFTASLNICMSSN